MSSRPFGTRFGEILREQRKRAGLSQQELGEAVEPSYRFPAHSIMRWEKGIRLPDVEQLVRLCEALRTTPNRLMDYPAKKKAA